MGSPRPSRPASPRPSSPNAAGPLDEASASLGDASTVGAGGAAGAGGGSANTLTPPPPEDDGGPGEGGEGASSGAGPDVFVPPWYCLYQQGVLRSNCIDCLDRTNVAQFAYGLVAFGLQLFLLGVAESPEIDSGEEGSVCVWEERRRGAWWRQNSVSELSLGGDRALWRGAWWHTCAHSSKC